MSVTKTILPDSRVEFSGEVPANILDAHITRAWDDVTAHAEVEGFRKGKAPKEAVARVVDERHVLERAAEMAVREAWISAINETAIEAIGEPEIEILKLAPKNPLIWKGRVAVLPNFTLPDWKYIARTVRERNDGVTPNVTDENVTKVIESFHASQKKEGELPRALDDAWAQTIAGASSLLELRDRVRKNLEHERAMKEKERVRFAILADIDKTTKLILPEILALREQERMLRELKDLTLRMGLTWKDYLERAKKTEDEIKNDTREDAERRARYWLILRAIAKETSCGPSEKKIDEAANEWKKSVPEKDRGKVNEGALHEYVRERLETEAVFTLLEAEEKSA